MSPGLLMDDPLFIAVDLGAGSGRVFLAAVSAQHFLLEEAHRFHYPPRLSGGCLRWDFARILSEIQKGLATAAEGARQIGGKVLSIGVDGWGVDYGLIDSAGRLVEDPICYRDHRTDGAMELVFERVPRAEIFSRTGIQFLQINTLFQLYAHSRSGIPSGASRMLLIPDLINLSLTGRSLTEYTNATTTQMVNARTGSWDSEMLRELDLPSWLLTPIVPAGSDHGLLKSALAGGLGLASARIIAPATHDTGSAVAGAPLEQGWAYISSGTWSLVGIERNEPLINSESARRNFTNEGGAFGTIRFLKNVMGLWILESCRSEWRGSGLESDYDGLLRRMRTSDEVGPLIFPDDTRLFNPPSMVNAIAEQLAETGQVLPAEPALFAKLILDSLALRYASVLRDIESLTGQPIEGVQIVGGGSRNDYLSQATATASGKPVLAGPAESAVIGNTLVQSIAAGRFACLADARQAVARAYPARRFAPIPSSAWDRAAKRYAALEARYGDTDA